MSPRQLRVRLWTTRVALIAIAATCAIAVHLSTRGTAPMERYTAAQNRTSAALGRRIPLIHFDNVPIPDAIASLAQRTAVRIVLDDAVAALAAQRLVNERLSDIYGFEAPLVLIQPLGLTQDNYFVRPDGAIVIMTTQRLAHEAVWREYDLRPVFETFGQRLSAKERIDAETELVSLIRKTVAPRSWREDGGAIGEISVEDGRLRVRHLPDEQWMIWSLLDQFLARDQAMAYLKDRLTGKK